MKLSKKDRLLVKTIRPEIEKKDPYVKGKIILLNEIPDKYDQYLDINNKIKSDMVEVLDSTIDGIRPGDVLIIHHNAEEFNKATGRMLSDGSFIIDRESGIYCRINGDNPEALMDYCILEPIPEAATQNGIYIRPSVGNKTNRGKVRSIGPDFPDIGIQVGDVVVFNKTGHIPVNFKGYTYWRIEERHVLGLGDGISDEELKRMNDERQKTNEEWRKIHSEFEWVIAQKREKDKHLEAGHRVRKIRGKSEGIFIVPGSEV